MMIILVLMIARCAGFLLTGCKWNISNTICPGICTTPKKSSDWAWQKNLEQNWWEAMWCFGWCVFRTLFMWCPPQTKERCRSFKLWTNVRDPDLEMQWFQRFLRIGTQLASSYSPGSFASQPWGQSCKNCSPQHREWNQAHRTPEKSHQRETLSHFAGSFCWCCSGHVFHINEHCVSHAHLPFFLTQEPEQTSTCMDELQSWLSIVYYIVILYLKTELDCYNTTYIVIYIYDYMI